MCLMLPDPNFLVSEVELPKEKHSKNSGPLFGKVHFTLFSGSSENRKMDFFPKREKSGPEFLICFSLGNSTSFTKKLGLGNIGHMDFWEITLF